MSDATGTSLHRTRESNAPSAEAAALDSAWRHAGSHARLWIVAAGGLAADLATKAWAFSDPRLERGLEIIPHVTTFRRSLNTGALFGMGKGLTPLFIGASLLALGFVLFLFVQSTRHRRSLHVALGLVLAGAVGNLYDRAFVITDVVRYRPAGQSRTATEAGILLEENDAFIVLGAYPEGQPVQRIPQSWAPSVRRQGVVRDFIKMEPQFKLFGRQVSIWPWVFNVADALLVAGVGLLMLNFWRERRDERRAASAAPCGSAA